MYCLRMYTTFSTQFAGIYIHLHILADVRVLFPPPSTFLQTGRYLLHILDVVLVYRILRLCVCVLSSYIRRVHSFSTYNIMGTHLILHTTNIIYLGTIIMHSRHPSTLPCTLFYSLPATTTQFHYYSLFHSLQLLQSNSRSLQCASC